MSKSVHEEIGALLNELSQSHPFMPMLLMQMTTIQLDMLTDNQFEQTYTTKDDFEQAVNLRVLGYLRDEKAALTKARLVVAKDAPLAGQMFLPGHETK